MTIAVTIVHNKTDQENEAQITALSSLLEVAFDIFDETDEQGNVIGQIQVPYHKIIGLDIDHRVKVFQVIPFGVTSPPSIYAINSGGIVYYGVGDENKVGTHPRFFNWGLKRGTDNGAEIAVYLQDPASLTGTKARQALAKLRNDTEFVEESWGKIATLRLLKEVGQLKEDRTFSEAVTDYKGRISQGGLKIG